VTSGTTPRRTWWTAFAIASAIHLLALYTPRQVGPEMGIPYIDKVGHVLVFAIVAYTGLKAGLRARPLGVVLLLNAVLSEVVQHFVLPQRSGDAFDTLADAAGVALGLFAATRR
jgi:hypothetical protein